VVGASSPASCTLCATALGGSFSFGGSACAQCSSDKVFVSSVAGCALLPTSHLGVVAGPVDTALLFSGSASEGVGAYAATQPAGLSFASDHLNRTAGALRVAPGSFLTSAPLPQLPTGGAARSVSAWVRCAQSSTQAPSPIVEFWDGLGLASAPTERLIIVGGKAGAPAGIAASQFWVASTLAGSLLGSAGYIDAVGTNSLLSKPEGVAVSASGYIYVADSGNVCIRSISPSGLTTTLAGSNRAMLHADLISTSAGFSTMREMTMSGNLLYLADVGRFSSLRSIDVTTGQVLTVAGLFPGQADGIGTAAKFNGALFPLGSAPLLHAPQKPTHLFLCSFERYCCFLENGYDLRWRLGQQSSSYDCSKWAGHDNGRQPD
jgi:NHL repeat